LKRRNNILKELACILFVSLYFNDYFTPKDPKYLFTSNHILLLKTPCMNTRTYPSGRKVTASEKERKERENTVFCLQCPRAVHAVLGPILFSIQI
jgi:hypothetical protein